MKKIFYLVSFLFFAASYANSPNEFCNPTQCVTKFGSVLGQSMQIPAYSNCRSECISYKPNSISKTKLYTSEDIYSGMSWQCVEYARRWWMSNFGITFGDVETADEIFTKKPLVTRVIDKTKISKHNYKNGSKIPPKFGDLLVYKKNKDLIGLQYGHVAVVVNVNLNDGYIDVAEQNYNNEKWAKNNDYSRRIILIYQPNEQKYFIYDKTWEKKLSYEDLSSEPDLILGWVSPF